MSCEVPITTGEAARMLGVSYSTVLEWCKRGYLPTIVFPSGRRRVWRHDVEAILNGRSIEKERDD